MTEHRRTEGLARLGLVAVVALALASFGSAATALADPGTPGLDAASSAVYPNPVVDQDVLGEGESSSAGSVDEPPSAVADSPSEASLPFTGLSAPVLLAVSLLLLGAGLTLRRIRPSQN